MEILLSLITCKFSLGYINILVGFAFILWYKVKFWSDVRCQFGQIKHRLRIVLLCWLVMQVNGNKLGSSDEVVSSFFRQPIRNNVMQIYSDPYFCLFDFLDFRGYLWRRCIFFCIMFCSIENLHCMNQCSTHQNSFQTSVWICLR